MSGRAILFMAWCGALLLGSAIAAHFAYSPYADAQHGGHHGGRGGAGYGYGGYYGPMHK